MSTVNRDARAVLLSTAMAVTCLYPASNLAAQASQNRADQSSETLEDGFRNPPPEARPRVWWHWMNGNVSEDGIAKDLAWMKRIGIGGLQTFDAALTTPQVVDKRLPFMSPEWKRAFKFAVERADALGMEFGIAASPGWSETGGPWVTPKEAMKKLVWSETLLEGRKRFAGILPRPPAIGGPYQEVPAEPSEHTFVPPPAFYQDSVVLAYRASPSKALPPPSSVTANGTAVDTGALFDGNLTTTMPLPRRSAAGAGTVAIVYGQPQSVRSATVFVTHIPLMSPLSRLTPRLEASDDGQTWRKITDLALSNAPTTVSFAPVTARQFRLIFASGKGTDVTAFAPATGADLSAIAGGGPTPPSPELAEFRLSASPRVNAAEQKAGFVIADDYYALDAGVGPDVNGVAPESVVDLTDRMTPNGRLDWTPPAGRWKVLRLGYSLTGTVNHPATAEATGLEVDKYDRDAVGRYMDTYLGMYRAITGDALMGGRGLGTIVTDSTEVGASNWTPQMIALFKQLRGYDLRPWLPALTGEIVGSRARSDAFLYDYRRTLADLATTEHYGTVARVAHANGLKVYGESLEGQRAPASLGDDLDMRRFADVPMAALWSYPKGKKPAARFVADVRGAASVAHLYGRDYVAAESLSSIFTPWGHSPADLQPMIDAEFVNGINRPIIHTSVHQPVDKAPGLSLLVFGQYFNRHETWAEMAKPWMDYIARTSFMLQQGRNVADVAYFYGEEGPVGQLFRDGAIQGTPKRYAYDFVSAEGVMNALAVDQGQLTSKGGARYRVLYLGGTSSKMTLGMLKRLAELAEAGATIVGQAPASSPSLTDNQDAYDALVRRLWAGGHVTPVGKGQVIAATDVEAALAEIRAAPDFTYAATGPADVQFVHRQLAEGELYFVDNRTDAAQQVEARFRVKGKEPEIWHSDTGIIEPASYRTDGEQTVVPLEMRANESMFVVFRKSSTTGSRAIAPVHFIQTADVRGPWKVAFQEGRGAPASVRLELLGSLSQQQDAGVKYFSGIATYTSAFSLPRGLKKGKPMLLDLGQVGDVAEVRVNGQLAGTVWKAPYRVDVGTLIRSGRNTLDIRVANLWVNRLIGDAQPGAQKIAFTTLKTYTAKAPLRPSGLIGPVTLSAPAQK